MMALHDPRLQGKRLSAINSWRLKRLHPSRRSTDPQLDQASRALLGVENSDQGSKAWHTRSSDSRSPMGTEGNGSLLQSHVQSPEETKGIFLIASDI